MFKQLPDSQAETVEVILNGQKIEAPGDITVAALSLIQGLRFTRTTPISATKRGSFCMMGVCYECLMVIDGIANQRACTTTIKNGMRIDRQQGTGPEMGDVFE